MDEIHFLRHLVIGVGCAAPVVYVFHRLKQSPIVGFVFSGALIGPFGLSLIRDVGSVNTLAIVGVMVLGIIRENRTLNNPGPDERILSGDRLVLSGTKEQLRKAIQMLTGPGTGRSP
jgi:hypothetical protein